MFIFQKLQWVLFAMLMLPGFSVIAQDSTNGGGFSLFEPVETSGNNDRTTGSGQPSQRVSRATAAAPVFTLVGTSRIGERRAAIVKHQDGSEVPVTLSGQAATPIPGYEQYTLVDISGGSAHIRYPDGAPCEAFEDKGVRCDGPGVARLSLTNASPLVKKGEEAVSAEENTETARSRNPFEIIRERARAGQQVVTDQADANSTRIRPRRIAPEDVPPGMRVVSTPFGDRLVEE